jgi:lipid-binding SYLF domain-containing protein
MKKLTIALLSIYFLTVVSISFGWDPNSKDKMELGVAEAILSSTESDPDLASWFESAAGYAVFPSVKKGGIGWGGARGKGLLIQGDNTLGEVTLTQVTVGLQLGGQVYAEFIFFKDQTALDEFTRGNFEMGAQMSAVALSAGASLDANYSGGVAVFTIAGGGLMYEASVGGQNFDYEAR